MSISLDAANALESAIDGKIRQAAAPRRRASGTVSRVDKDGTVYAVLESGIETVVEGLTASVNPGDTVNVTIEDGRAEVLGNYTDPSAGVQYVRAVEGIAAEAGATAHAAVDSAAAARQVADEANKVAQATNQHFFADTNGAHITDVTQDEWAAAVDDNFSDYDPTTKPYHNQLLNSLGILLRTALNNLVSITRSAIAFYDGTGNAAANIVARFGSAGAQIGLTDESHLSLDYHSMQMVDKEGDIYFLANDLRDASGYITQKYTGDGSTTIYYLGFTATDTGYSVLINDVEQPSTAFVSKSTTAFRFTTAPAANAVITASFLPAAPYHRQAKAYTFGKPLANQPVGEYSVREGYRTIASGSESHAEGYGAQALGTASHAEGTQTQANLSDAHAEGYESVANGAYSHAQGYRTYAQKAAQFTCGTYNVKDTASGTTHPNGQAAYGKYALIIGNGTADNARSNAFAVKWDGTLETAQDIPWTELTLASGWTAYSTARTPMYRRVGSMVEIRGAVKPTAETSLGTSSVTFGTLPQGCRPVNMEVSAICQGSGVKVWMLTVDTDGNVCASRMRTMNSTAYQSAGTSEFMIFDVSFLAG